MGRLIVLPSRRVLLAAVTAALVSELTSHSLQGSAWAQSNVPRIGASEVKLANLDAFKTQLQHDLPIGTPKDEVETYLTRGEFRHLFLDNPVYGQYDKTFQVVLLDIGSRLGFTTTLNIWIHLDDGDRVREIAFRLQYL